MKRSFVGMTNEQRFTACVGAIGLGTIVAFMSMIVGMSWPSQSNNATIGVVSGLLVIVCGMMFKEGE